MRKRSGYPYHPVKQCNSFMSTTVHTDTYQQFSVRLSPERFGQRTEEIRDVASELLVDPRLDYLDMSLWDVFKEAHDEAFAGQSLMKVFTDLPRKGVALGAAGKLYSAEACEEAIESGLDFVLVGRAAVIHADFPNQALANPDFEMQIGRASCRERV